MANANTELRNFLNNFQLHKDGARILAATVTINTLSYDAVKAALIVGYTEEDFTEFLDKIYVSYDAGYGGQNLYGTLWFTDGTWATRGEYDGSEWWEYHILPDIPDELKGV